MPSFAGSHVDYPLLDVNVNQVHSHSWFGYLAGNTCQLSNFVDHLVPFLEQGTIGSMIHRTWRARATRDNAAHYLEHFRDEVVPVLRATTGYLGAVVVDQELDGEVEITVTTRWRTLEDIQRFAGADPAAAVVQPAARTLLRSFDARVTHHVERYRDP